MLRPIAVLLCSVLLALTGAAPGGAVESEGYGIRLIDAPTDRRDDPRARLYVVDHVQQGDAFSRRFEVTNGTAAPVRLDLYPAAATIRDGSFVIGDGRAENELTEWISVTPSFVELAPGQRAQATLKVTVPPGVEDGERYAAVLAEAPPVTTGGGNIGLGSRVGIRVYLGVGQGAEPASDFAIESLQAARADDGTPIVTATVRNTGGRALDLRGELALEDGPGGLSAGPFPAELGTTLGVGDSEDVLVRLPEAITGGPWRAVLTLKSSNLEKAAEAKITFPDEAGTKAAPVKAKELSPAEDPKVLVPIAGSLILLVLLGLLTFFYRRRTRLRRRDRDEKASGPPPAVPAERS